MREFISMQRNDKEVTLKKAFDDFLCEKKVLKLSEATIKAYEYKFEVFTDFLPADSLCSSIGSNSIFRFIEFLQTRNPDIKAVSINTYLRHLRAIFYSFMELGYMKHFKIKLLKCEKDLVETYNEVELERLLKSPIKRNADFQSIVLG